MRRLVRTSLVPLAQQLLNAEACRWVCREGRCTACGSEKCWPAHVS